MSKNLTKFVNHVTIKFRMRNTLSKERVQITYLLANERKIYVIEFCESLKITSDKLRTRCEISILYRCKDWWPWIKWHYHYRTALSVTLIKRKQRMCTDKTTIFPKYGSWISKTIKFNGKWLKYDINTIYSWYVSDITLIMSQNIIWYRKNNKT